MSSIVSRLGSRVVDITQPLVELCKSLIDEAIKHCCKVTAEGTNEHFHSMYDAIVTLTVTQVHNMTGWVTMGTFTYTRTNHTGYTTQATQGTPRRLNRAHHAGYTGHSTLAILIMIHTEDKPPSYTCTQITTTRIPPP